MTNDYKVDQILDIIHWLLDMNLTDEDREYLREKIDKLKEE